MAAAPAWASPGKALAGVEAGDASLIIQLAKSPDALAGLQALSARETHRLADALAKHVDAALSAAAPALELDDREEEEEGRSARDSASAGDALELLAAASVVLRSLISEPKRPPPSPLHAAAVALHDVIFFLQDARASELQAAIVELCEAWWLAELPGRDELVPQTVSYLLVRALHEKATPADVKRLWAFRSSLQILDYTDESVGPLKKLLLHCAIRPLFLRCPEGRKLLIYMFGLHPPFIAEIHRAVKGQLLVCRKSHREAYGEIYFKAWRAASGPYLTRIEEDCFQDLMFHAAHASSTALATALRQVLAYTHEQKRQRGVDQMLNRLYEPILWRSIRVANANVRRNAAMLFVEAFPLQDPTLPCVELDGLLQQQFDALQTLLKDDSTAVRVVAVHGACRILALYGELIPTLVSRSLLQQLTKELAHDASANAVRVAVFQGIKFLVANYTASSTLGVIKAALPPLAPLIHDGSERVRTAMLELCLELGKVRGLHWQQLVKADSLLLRLPLEKTGLQQRLTRLLLPIYLPTGKAAVQQLGRLLDLAFHRGACLAIILRHAPQLATPTAVVRLLRLLLAAMLSDAEAETLVVEEDVASLPRRREPLPLPHLEALCCCLASLMDSAGPLLSQPQNQSQYSTVQTLFSAEHMGVLQTASSTSPVAQRALVRVAAWLPAANVPQLFGSATNKAAEADCLREIALQPSDAPPSQLAPLLQCACAWEQDGRLLQQVHLALQPADAPSGVKRGRPQRGRAPRSKAAESEEPQLSTELALRIVWASLDTPATRSTLLRKQLKPLKQLLQPLGSHVQGMAAAAATGSAPQALSELLVGISCYVQLAWHLAEAEPSAPMRTRGKAAAAAVDVDAQQEGLAHARDAIHLMLTCISEAFPAPAAEEGQDGRTGDGDTSSALTEGTQRVGAATADEDATQLVGEALRPLNARSTRSKSACEPSPGEARPKTRQRMGAAKTISSVADHIIDIEVSPSAAARVLLSVWLAEAAGLGVYDARLAAAAVRFVCESLLLCRLLRNTRSDESPAYASLLGQLLPHAAKLALQLLELGSDLAHHGEELLVACLSTSCGAEDATMRGTVRTILLEVLAVHQAHASSELVHRLFAFAVSLMPAEAHTTTSSSSATKTAPARDSAPSASLQLLLPPLAALVVDVLLRSPHCAEAILPALQRLLSDDSPSTALRCVQLLLACDSLHSAEQPGAASLRLSLQRLSTGNDEREGSEDGPSQHVELATAAGRLLAAIG